MNRNITLSRIGLRAGKLGLVVALTACNLIDPPPTDEQALQAVQEMGKSMGLALPQNFLLAAVFVKACTRQQQPAGHVCDVVLVSQEIPVIGVITMPQRLRFTTKEQRWVAFLN